MAAFATPDRRPPSQTDILTQHSADSSGKSTKVELRMDEDRPAQASLSSPTRQDEPDPRQSLQHVLSSAPAESRPRSVPAQTSGFQSVNRQNQDDNSTTQLDIGREETEEEDNTLNDAMATPEPAQAKGAGGSSRRNPLNNGTIGSVYSGNKIQHLKKDDGIPLWRKDIQYAFLRAVFEDESRVFTMASDASKGHTFSEIYLDAMAKSSKTSKVLKEKLMTDRPSALNMAMVCLLVNVGRMNTTLNCS